MAQFFSLVQYAIVQWAPINVDFSVTGVRIGLLQVVLILLKIFMLSWSLSWNYYGFVLHVCFWNYPQLVMIVMMSSF